MATATDWLRENRASSRMQIVLSWEQQQWMHANVKANASRQMQRSNKKRLQCTYRLKWRKKRQRHSENGRKRKEKKQSQTREVSKIREQEPTRNRFVFIFIIYMHTRVQCALFDVFRNLSTCPLKGTFAHVWRCFVVLIFMDFPKGWFGIGIEKVARYLPLICFRFAFDLSKKKREKRCSHFRIRINSKILSSYFKISSTFWKCVFLEKFSLEVKILWIIQKIAVAIKSIWSIYFFLKFSHRI